MKSIWKLLPAGLLALAVGFAMAADPKSSGAKPGAKVAGTKPSEVRVAPGTADAAEQELKSEYVLGPGDVVRITVFQNPELTTETRVSENGRITFPLVGAVSVGGQAIPAAEGIIAKALKDGGFVLQPQVNMLVLQMRGNQVAVLGQVNRPGRFPLETTNVHVSEMLAQAGGITPTGADTLILTGTRNGKPIRMEIDVPSLFLSEKTDQDPKVQAGDIIYIHRAPMFYIYGEVQRPGAYRLERGMTVMQALAQGGGLTLRGTQRGIEVHRKDKAGVTQAYKTEMTAPVAADDVIYVKESLF